MKNKDGFTLVELLAVIVVLALLVSIAVPSTVSISNRLKKKMYCSKIDSIETAAALYGEDIQESFINTIDYTGPDPTNPNKTVTLKNLPSKQISVEELVDKGYLKKDQDTMPYIVDPRDKTTEELYKMEFIVYVKYNRIYVRFNEAVRETCDK